jgi:hypothetical protein
MTSAIRILCALFLASSVASAATDTVKVFILSGQSNMVGWANTRTMGELGKHEKHGDLLAKVQGPDGTWIARDDVFVYANVDDHKRHGKLSVGYGGNATDQWIGPELMFGLEMGDHFEEPVLLIKAAWGGKDLYCDFRPPSAGEPEYEMPERNGEARDQGANYRKLVQEVHECLDNRDQLFPSLKGMDFELCGFVWVQGWNEMYAGEKVQGQVYSEYAQNYAHLLTDLRQEFNAGDMVSVVGELGIDGDQASDNVRRFRKAQRRILKQASIRRSTRFVETAHCWDANAEQVRRDLEKVKSEVGRKLESKIRKGLSSELKGKDEQEQKKILRNAVQKAVEETEECKAAQKRWDAVGSHWLCHYNGSASAYCLVGYELAVSMKELL